MAPADVWHKWMQRYHRGEHTIQTVSGEKVNMRVLVKQWKKITKGDIDGRNKFIADHVVPVAQRPKKLPKKQPKWKSGHDTQRVRREVVILKNMKSHTTYARTVEILRGTGKCSCTPCFYGCNEDERMVIMEDVGETLQEKKEVLGKKEKQALIKHFRREHRVVFAPCQVSPQNLCRRQCGSLCLIDVAKWKWA